ncbi:Male sterility, NAD-binding,Zinc finger, FLYWCH-type [Cinara cedri]|uniref:Fatty acyl-CoA reductase n=1 Tax=Cinara cedri TaxID=506608 RepID=A0A5E4MH08_9HEMI|nr:Male sterility, NAD-binding,Zinc finger, FLYWCH-type [Cinara cedri]
MTPNSVTTILKESKLIYDDFVYVLAKMPINGKIYWECKQVRGKLCKTTTITKISEQKINVVREPTLEDHNYVFEYSLIATVKEPIPGWINNFYGPTGVVAAADIGLMRVMLSKPDGIAEMVPADYFSNAVLACAWDFHNKWNQHNEKTTIKDDCCSLDNKHFSPLIYNYVSSNTNPIT